MLTARIIQLTVPCTDNGRNFICTERLERIKLTLADSAYACVAALPLASVYQHREFQVGSPALLVSNHVDSVYSKYSASLEDREIRGTLDNSACNAIAVELMLADRLPPQTLVSFTGDEEGDSAGVDQTVSFLEEHDAIFWNLEMVVTLDLTEQFSGSHDFTIENYFVEERNDRALLKFRRKRDLKDYLSNMLDAPVFVKDAEPDESWQYDEHDLNCLSLCLPCRLLGPDMHSDKGVAIREGSLARYADTLAHLTRALDRDLANREHQRNADRRR